MNRVAAIEQLRATQETLEKLLVLLESSEDDVSHLPLSPRILASLLPTLAREANRSNAASSESLGFKGEFRQWKQPSADRRLITRGYRDPISDVRRIPQLETACFTEENGLPSRQYDFFSVP